MDWDLTSYFPTFDGPDYRQFRDRLRDDLGRLQQPLDEAMLPADALAERLVDFEAASVRFSHLASYLGCLTAADSANEAYAKEEAALAQDRAGLTKGVNLILESLASVDRSGLEKLKRDSRLEGAAYALERFYHEAGLRMPPAEEALAADLAVDGFDAWGRLYDNLAGNLEFEMVDPEGKRTTRSISQRRSLLGHPDRRVRKAAFEGGNRSWQNVARVTGAALNSLAGTRQVLRSRRGQEHFLQPALFDARLDRPCLDALLEALRGQRESAREMLRFRASEIGLKQVAWYDLEAPISGSSEDEAAISWPTACAWVQGAFDRAYPALGAFFRSVVEQRWIDWSPRPGKRPGGFCTSSPFSRESRIFMTYDQTVNDVMTLAHEVGHAFHSHLLSERRGLVSNYPMPLAETASTFAEQILIDGIINDPESPVGRRRRLLDSQVRHAVTFMLDIPIRFEFECRFHEERLKGEIGVSRLNELMVDTQREWLGDTLEAGGEDPLFWASKLHFYITGLSFYNFPYTFGFLLSRRLYGRFRQEGTGFLPEYEAFLKMTSVRDADDLIRDVLDEDPADPAFWNSAIDTLREPFAALRQENGPS